MAPCDIPVDSRQVSESEPTLDEYARAQITAQQLREKILANPRGCAAYVRATREIESHQSMQ